MKAQVLTQAIAECADPERATRGIEQLRETSLASLLKKLNAAQARLLSAIVAGSQHLLELLVTHPDWLPPLLEADFLKSPRQAQGLLREVDQWLKPFLKRNEYEAAFAALRQFKQREMLRIAARDLGRLAEALEITGEISNVADVCLNSVYRLCYQNLSQRFGSPFHLDAQGRWRPSQFCAMGLGKLGGQELNYSSDVDVMFVYSEEGHVFKSPPRPNEEAGKGLANHQFFTRLAEALIAEISRMTADGVLFRIDLRLRPEGRAGPLVRSIDSYENFYAQWGQTWERMMLIKARPVAGDDSLGAEFLEMVQPFRYPRSLSQRTVREVAAVKTRIETEVVKQGEMERNVKLGRGGIREIEFVVQTQQILRAGHSPFLQGASTVPVLRKLAEYSLVAKADAKDLEEAYIFLRDVEHRLQMEANQQTHTIPTERKARERLARLMGFESVPDFESARGGHSRNARRVYDKLFAAEQPEPRRVLPEEGASDETWEKLLARHSFRDPARAREIVGMFLDGPGYAHISPRTAELARELLPRFFSLCPQAGKKISTANVLSDPDRVLVRLDSFVDAYAARATLYELWTQKPSLFALILFLFDRSEFLAELAIRTPDLVDELEASGRLQRSKTAEETLRDLRHGANDADQKLWLRKYHQAEFMRIGLRDILGLADYEQNMRELTALADACLQYGLETITRSAKLKAPPFCVVGMGKLGGHEINYGSDLDILFVAKAGAKNLPQLQGLAVEFFDLLGDRTEAGAVFHLDTRLRPDGEKGLLVNTTEAFEEYYRRRAGLWEIQALTRVRPIAGDLETGKHFSDMAAALANFSPENIAAKFAFGKGKGLAAFTADWKKEIAAMRGRIERERTPAGKDALAMKTGAGGLMDAEFLAQAFCLERGWQQANTMRAVQQGAEAGLLAPANAAQLVENYGKLRRIEGILRRWSYEGETVLPDDEPALYRVSVRCGFSGAKEFMTSLAEMRGGIRATYVKYFSERGGGLEFLVKKG
jgi:glutamate-ammonia-ligase adenylyltransferase